MTAGERLPYGRADMLLDRKDGRELLLGFQGFISHRIGYLHK